MKIVAIVGTYRKGMVIDTAVSKVLEGARSMGADTEKIYLTDTAVEFCRNCRQCTADPTEGARGKCVIDDQMSEILDKIDAADGIILASPINFGCVTAITKRFIERLAVYVKWKLDGKVRPPTKRIKHKTKRAVVITASTVPMIIGRILAPGVLNIMTESAGLMGAKVICRLWFGMLPAATDIKLSPARQLKAYKIGRKLAQ